MKNLIKKISLSLMAMLLLFTATGCDSIFSKKVEPPTVLEVQKFMNEVYSRQVVETLNAKPHEFSDAKTEVVAFSIMEEFNHEVSSQDDWIKLNNKFNERVFSNAETEVISVEETSTKGVYSATILVDPVNFSSYSVGYILETIDVYYAVVKMFNPDLTDMEAMDIALAEMRSDKSVITLNGMEANVKEIINFVTTVEILSEMASRYSLNRISESTTGGVMFQAEFTFSIDSDREITPITFYGEDVETVEDMTKVARNNNLVIAFNHDIEEEKKRFPENFDADGNFIHPGTSEADAANTNK